MLFLTVAKQINLYNKNWILSEVMIISTAKINQTDHLLYFLKETKLM